MKQILFIIFLILFTSSLSAQKVILAKIEIKPSSLKDFVLETQSLIELTRKEVNCLSFNIHQEKENPNAFVIHEIFKDEDAFQKHLTQQYVKQWFKNLEYRKISELEIIELQILKK